MTGDGAGFTYLAGGRDAQHKISKQVWRFQFGTNLWNPLTPLPFEFENGEVALSYSWAHQALLAIGRKQGETQLTALILENPMNPLRPPLYEYGPACTGSNSFTLTSDSCTGRGTSVALDINGLPATTPVWLSASLTGIAGRPTPCGVHLTNPFFSQQVLSGPGAFTLPIPNDPALIGTPLYFQGFHLLSGTPTTSSSVRMVIGT